MAALSKNYLPGKVEEKWYEHWKKKQYFKSTPDSRPPYTIVIPPPNVTGVLHMGHTLNETVQDILARRARMNGFNVCWVPGSDHASIATEAKVVQMLQREKGIQKRDLSREEFLKHAFEWKEKYGSIIYDQIAKLGCSVDWDRVSFTMDDHYYKAVIKVFVDLYHKGLIYRGARMINWDTEARTALSDEEVEYKEVTGKLYYLKYEMVEQEDSEKQFITIATQRPETIMGDVAVCMHPDDARYKHLKGKQVYIPLLRKAIPVIFDEYVEKEFGTGVLKITPAHDIHDYNIGLKHHLPVVDTLNEDGTLSEEAQIFIGEDRFEARKKIVARLKKEGLLINEEEYETRMGFSQRTQSVVEPRISTQWFVKMQELAKPALEEVRSGNIQIHPWDKFMATYTYWLENVKDWCISRQLWWGQQIPAWYDEEGNVHVAETEEEAREEMGKKEVTNSKKQVGGSKKQVVAHDSKLRRDEDVLDTWFSSWLWPIQVFEGITEPDNPDIQYYYPTSVLVTGQDIMFFWVARMIMAGIEFRQEKPFSDVYFTGMVRDHLGRKMSKSLGNSPDLLELIREYGADAVRFGIMISAPAGNDLLFEESSLEQGKHFNNKLWNALKLIQIWSSHDAFGKVEKENSPVPFAIKWFESRLEETKATVEDMMKNYRLSEALKTIYSLIWNDFCSWYLEWIKPPYGQTISRSVHQHTILFFDELLQLLHPFMPFITEEIYHQLQERDSDLMVSMLKPAKKPDIDILKAGEHLKDLITCIRDARNKHSLRQKESISLYIETQAIKDFDAFGAVLTGQVNSSVLLLNQSPGGPSLRLVCGSEKIQLVSNSEINSDAQKENLTKDLKYLKGFLISVEKKLGNDKFVLNARPDVIERERKKKADAEEKIKVIEQSLSALSQSTE